MVERELLKVSSCFNNGLGTKSVGVLGGEDKRQITGFPVIAADGTLVGKQIIFAGKTNRCLPTEKAGLGVLFSHSSSHWTQLQTLKELVVKLLRPYVDQIKLETQKPGQRAIFILDVYSVHICGDFLAWMKANHSDILLHFIPPGCTGKLQVGDLVVNKKMKDIIKLHGMEYVAKTIQTQLEQHKSTTTTKISVDVKMSVLKPLLCGWIDISMEWFRTVEGKQLILAGFTQSGTDICWNVDFQTEAFKIKELERTFEGEDTPTDSTTGNNFKLLINR